MPDNVAQHLIGIHTTMLTVHEIRVLATLRSRQRGICSAREVARIAGVSPTTASKALRHLMGIGLVRRDNTRMMFAGQVTHHAAYRLDTSHENWQLVRRAVDSTVLPKPPVPRSDTVPKRYWHMFWNAEPARLRVDEHGAYIARRMLNAQDLSAAMWALDNVSRQDIASAVAGRGVDEKTRAFVLNYLGSGQVA